MDKTTLVYLCGPPLMLRRLSFRSRTLCTARAHGCTARATLSAMTRGDRAKAGARGYLPLLLLGQVQNDACPYRGGCKGCLPLPPPRQSREGSPSLIAVAWVGCPGGEAGGRHEVPLLLRATRSSRVYAQISCFRPSFVMRVLGMSNWRHWGLPGRASVDNFPCLPCHLSSADCPQRSRCKP